MSVDGPRDGVGQQTSGGLAAGVAGSVPSAFDTVNTHALRRIMDHGTQCPIYHQVSDDLGVFPMAMRRRTHRTFMVEHRQEEWLAGAIARMNAWVAPLPARPSRRLRAVRSR